MIDGQQKTPRNAFGRRLAHIYHSVGYDETSDHLGDFTTSKRVVLISLLAAVVGTLSAFIALALLRLIGLFTNLFFFQRWNTTISSPADSDLGIFILVVPIIGATIVGFMARYGSERIRGHGIPEALEAILMNRSRVEPRVAILKPLSSAIAIGSGGPFGAEGPIIMTGGAFGSIIAQLISLTGAERKTLLVAGAAGGMAATFATPVAAVMLAVELLLFEWKPRSLIPVAVSSAMATLMRHYLLGSGPLFPVPAHHDFIGPLGLLGCVVVGLSAGVLAAILTNAVYASEDAFAHLPIHWMWWPAIGGLVIGLGGLVFPEALGVGYGSIQAMLDGSATTHLLVGMLLVKSAIWAISLGSGTSGGVLAPLLLTGGALGGIEAGFLPAEGPGFWSMVAMAAVLGSAMGSPLTAIVFALELTHDVNSLLPLLVTVAVAYGFTVLTLRRSILTEKISRRGYHLAREYSLDPLEITFVRAVMRTGVAALRADAPLSEVATVLSPAGAPESQRLFPVLDEHDRIVGAVSRTRLRSIGHAETDGEATIRSLIDSKPEVAFDDEPLRFVVYRMAESGFTRMPVVDRDDPTKLLGMVSLTDLLKARARNLDEERTRERPLRTLWSRQAPVVLADSPTET